MGHREDLLVGAKRCLIEKGYARTTARDIVAASGTNLASIGYHFGSKEALLNEALMQATEEWGMELGRAMAVDTHPDATPLERFEAIWVQVVELFGTHRQLWSANFEILAQIEHVPEVRTALTEANKQARPGLAAMFQGIDEDEDPKGAWVLGCFHQALLTGVMAQWLVDPETAPTGHDLAEAMRTIMAGTSLEPKSAATP
ncbi:DNA-binding transcriptional regulator, AcrR family [Amycolatopsis xylanica]|uniref:DNA-binding transcriptional regulator, AcrR family n=1 Tax=Amycolatopsis xylanica TaxID=589385 RepID=A0A1H3NFX6_9PSEU|nr:TetR/AcrR family transcriptional regulator [Amycolatopsis xylanica]SDY87796.1 DNA-binding transcriptional regulator, AcrR family [Amycolatopsis xylanica]